MRVSLARRGLLFTEGERATTLFRLRAGLMRLDRPDGSVQAVRPGELFDEWTALGEPAYRCTARALCDAEVETVDVNRARLCRDLLRQALTARDACLSGSVQRLGSLLADLSDNWIPHGPVQLTQGDLAAMTGLSRKTVWLRLNQWQAAGWVEIGREYLAVLDPDMLRTL